MSKEPDNIIEEKIRLECSNCGQETYVTGRVAEIWEFYNKHKTRIGNSYCHKDHLHLHIIEHNKDLLQRHRESMRERVEELEGINIEARDGNTVTLVNKDTVLSLLEDN